jgi:ABC-type transporter Mla MlaB component
MPDPAAPNRSLRLPADCTIAAIRGVYELIREAFSRHDRLEIDCSSVDKADLTSIQLLLSTTKTGEVQGRKVVLTAISQALRNSLRRAGFVSEAMIDHHFHQKKDGA